MFFQFVEKGNVTTYEWKYGEPPLKVEPPIVNYEFDEGPTTSESNDVLDLDVGTIDFGDLGGGDDIQLDTGLKVY